MSVQVIKQDDQPEWAVIPYDQYLELVENAEMLQDIQDYDRARVSLEGGLDELISADVVNAILEGENIIKVWREYRGLSQTQLAKKAGISVPYLSQLESGKRKGTIESLSSIAKALNLSLELIVPTNE